MTPFSYHVAESIADGSRQMGLAKSGSTRLLAGGTDLLPLMKAGIEHPDTLVGIRRLDDIPRDIRIEADGTRLGALTTLAQIADDAGLARHYPALAQAARQAASPQLRNMATLGGTLLQRPRCWYFRSPAFHCWLKGGSECHARTGMNQSHAVFDTGVCRAAHPSDLACALYALDAQVELRSADGTRSLPIADFIRPPTDERRCETVLRGEEILVAVRLPTAATLGHSVFLKAMDRNAWSFATASVAARMRTDADGIRDLGMAIGAVATIPWSLDERLSALRGSPFDAERATALLREAFADADPLTMNEYKIPLARSLAERALRDLDSASA